MKRNIKIFSRLLALLLCVAMATGTTHAQTPVGKKERHKIVEAISADWQEWDTASISGKFKMAGLPLSPSVKIFMQRDSSIIVSLRAPLMGEVGRAEITPDTLLVVNKMKKVYVKESLAEAMRYYPGSISDLQDLLLARVVIPGFGTLSKEIADVVEIFPEDRGEYSLVPNEEGEQPGYNYGYLIDADAFPSVLMVIPEANPEINVMLNYEFFDDGTNLNFSYLSPDRIYKATLELDFPVWGGSPIDPIKLNTKYTRLNLQQFLKSF